MVIDGQTFCGMLISAANALDNNKAAINNMNVFPVPDGDTGINMTLTMSTVRALKDYDGTISDCAEKVAGVILRSARGNSGAILSLFFRGMAKSLRGLEKADSVDIASAFKRGTEEAYKAVMNPTEGTILTVMRISSEKAMEEAKERFAGDVAGLFAFILDVAEDALSKTPDQLPVLREVNVVDAGGYGFVVVVSGMLDYLNHKPVIALDASSVAPKADFSEFTSEDIKYAYCTECIVSKSDAFRGEGTAGDFNGFLRGIGDSVVFIDDEEIIKVHVHTNHPGQVIEKALEFGSLETVKIENMRVQHSAVVASGETEKAREAKIAPAEKKYGFVAVCLGNGICDTFSDIGVDNIIFGGQTMNPSTQDIIDGVNMTPSEYVFVLPNNKNIYLVAQQAAKIVKDKKVIVLQTQSVPQGISAMIAFNPDGELDDNIAAMQKAVHDVKSMSVTYAVRDTQLDGHHISTGQILGLVDGNIACITDTSTDCISELASKMTGASFITLFYGENVKSESADSAAEIIRSKVGPDTEVSVFSGGQPLYDYIISVE